MFTDTEAMAELRRAAAIRKAMAEQWWWRWTRPELVHLWRQTEAEAQRQRVRSALRRRADGARPPRVTVRHFLPAQVEPGALFAGRVEIEREDTGWMGAACPPRRPGEAKPVWYARAIDTLTAEGWALDTASQEAEEAAERWWPLLPAEERQADLEAALASRAELRKARRQARR